MQKLLNKLQEFSATKLFFFFLLENLFVFIMALGLGYLILKIYQQKTEKITNKEWLLSVVTNILNTIVTYAGFYLWQKEFIKIESSLSISIVLDFLILFLVMDLLMYIFHLIIHRTFLYKYIHTLHHEAVTPQPIDLFILHPIEALSFGLLWLIVLTICAFNFYAVFIYLTLNVIFGIVGHLGFEPLPVKIIKSNKFIRYFGLSSFHHKHHLDIKHNFGFYTSIWDRIFGTYV